MFIFFDLDWLATDDCGGDNYSLMFPSVGSMSMSVIFPGFPTFLRCSCPIPSDGLAFQWLDDRSKLELPLRGKRNVELGAGACGPDTGFGRRALG